MKNKIIPYLLFTCLILLFSACSKNDSETEVNVAYRMIAEKNWFLEYAQTRANGTTTTANYTGQSTYFIKFLKDKTTSDSDGFSGTYQIIKNGEQLQVVANTKSSNGNANNYNYKLISLGEKKMILEFAKQDSTLIYYFNSTR
jgi:hypothetical protein